MLSPVPTREERAALSPGHRRRTATVRRVAAYGSGVRQRAWCTRGPCPRVPFTSAPVVHLVEYWRGPPPPFHSRAVRRKRRTSRHCPQKNNNILLPAAYGSRKLPSFIRGAPPPRIKDGRFPLPTQRVIIYYYSSANSFLAEAARMFGASRSRVTASAKPMLSGGDVLLFPGFEAREPVCPALACLPVATAVSVPRKRGTGHLCSSSGSYGLRRTVQQVAPWKEDGGTSSTLKQQSQG